MNKTFFAVTGIVRYKGKMLIVKKAPDDRNYPNHWSFCSGFVKEFEAGEETVLREIKEESGLKARIVKEGRIIHVKDKRNKKNWVVLPFLCEVDSDKVKLDHENVDYAWITKDKLDDYDFVPAVIDDLKSVGLL
jgi:ADP-ribose pyrophosphatase YjhB (NUDIX family)